MTAGLCPTSPDGGSLSLAGHLSPWGHSPRELIRVTREEPNSGCDQAMLVGKEVTMR